MEQDDCPECLGTKAVYNGEIDDFKICSLCKGTGKYYVDDSSDLNEDDLLINDSDFEEYNDNINYGTDDE